MEIDSCHFGIHVHSLAEAHEFYVETLGFEILQHIPAINLLAVKAGNIRISIFADRAAHEIGVAANAGGQIIFRTSSLAATIDALKNAGMEIPSIQEAPGFMKFISLRDPSGNLIEIAEYLRDPLAAI